MAEKDSGRDKGRDQREQDEPGREYDWTHFSRRLEGFVPDVVRRAVVTGVKSFLQTEEGLRSLVGAMIPKEALSYVAQQLDSSKNDVLRIVSRELRDFLRHIDLGGEIQKILTSISFEVTTQIRFVPNDKSVVKPDVAAGAQIKRKVKVRRATAAGVESADITEPDEPPGP